MSTAELAEDPNSPGMRRDLTVAELIELLLELPQHYPTAVMVDRTLGAIQDVWAVQSTHPDLTGGDATPVVVVGERP